jgi:hypothetical protein
MKEEWLMSGAVVPVDVETTAALVAEIHRLIDVVGGMALAQLTQGLDEAAIRADEREACAKVCDWIQEKAEFHGTDCCKFPTPTDCAHAIRARGNT